MSLSREGTRLVTTVATLNSKRNHYRNALWQIDPTGVEPAQRLTRSRKGESAATFTDAGDLLCTSARPDPDADDDDEPTAALWLLPAGGGDASLIGNRLGGYGKVQTHGSHVLTAAPRLTASTDEADDDRRRKERKDNNVSAILHASYPVRQWDHDLGPGADHLMAADLPGLATGADAEPARLALRDLTPIASAQHSPHAFVEQIRTPMLVVHGDRDYRVPIGEGLRLWWELLSRSELALDADGRTASCTSPTRTIGCSARNMQRSGTARYRRSW